MLKGLKLSIPITKVESGDDGTVIVEGIATSEALDSQGEVVEYEASKAAFAEWTGAFSKATDGKSLGNIREMHGDVAAGKAIAWYPDDAAKSITIKAHVVDPVAAKKCKESVYTMFSIRAPGGTVKRESNRVKAYQLSEVSLVDRGANPDSWFAMAKRDGLAKGLEEPGKDEGEIPETIVTGKPPAGEVDPAKPTAPELEDGESAVGTVDDAAGKLAGHVVRKADGTERVQWVKKVEAKEGLDLAKLSDVVKSALAPLAASVSAIGDRLTKIETMTPAPVGKPVQKTIGADGKGNAAGTEQVAAVMEAALEKAKADGASHSDLAKIRIAMAEELAKLAR